MIVSWLSFTDTSWVVRFTLTLVVREGEREANLPWMISTSGATINPSKSDGDLPLFSVFR